MRIGHGYDAHRLVQGRRLVLGGVDIAYDKGLLGHSDADVIAHAVIDAMLGAAALGDIGAMFPDSDMRYKDIDSMLLLRRAAEQVYERGYKLSNLDCTIIAEKPKLRDYIPEMKNNFASALKCASDMINIKATTEEKMGFTGDGTGICAHAVVLLE